MDDLKIKAYEYAEKVNRISDKTILDYMSGYQNCQQRPVPEVIEELIDRLKEGYEVVPTELVEELKGFIEKFKIFESDE